MRKISRRDLLKGGLGAAFTAGATSFSYFPEDKTKNLPNLREDEWTAQFLLEKYNMTDIETAQKLRDNIAEETANYGTFSIFSGLAYRTYNSVKTSDDAKEIGYSLKNIFTVPILNFFMGDRALELSGLSQNEPLVHPTTLVNNYGMIENNAKAFCYDYKNHLQRTIHFSSACIPFLIEFFSGLGSRSPIKKPSKKQPTPPKPH